MVYKLEYLSSSQINRYLMCPMSYYFSYVEKIKEMPKGVMILGSAVDKGITINYKQKVESRKDLNMGDVCDAMSDAFEAEKKIVDWKKEEEKSGEMKDDGIRLTRMYHSDVAPTIQPVSTQHRYKIYIPELGISFVGYTDVETDTGIVVDNKTSKKSPSKNKETGVYIPKGSHELQMQGYSFCHRSEYKKKEKGLRLDYLVRTKTPKYIPVTVPLPDNFTFFINMLRSVKAGIEKEVFTPNRASHLCTPKCYYWEKCNKKLTTVTIT